jgi:hypothetical protein
MKGLGLGRVADSFNVVTIGSNDKCGVVARMVVRAQTRRAVVLGSGEKGGLVERVHLGAIPSRKGQMQGAGCCAGWCEKEARLAIRAEAGALRALGEDGDAQRGERAGEETAAGA